MLELPGGLSSGYLQGFIGKRLPELSARQEDIEDWADAPEEGDDDPQHFP
jgi:hypothetical protein